MSVVAEVDVEKPAVVRTMIARVAPTFTHEMRLGFPECGDLQVL